MNNDPLAPRVPSYTGTGLFFYAWGAQIEIGSFPSSYIPTSGSMATRAMDMLYTTNIPWFNATQGALLTEIDALGASSQAAFSANFNNSGISEYIGTHYNTWFKPVGILTLAGAGKSSGEGSVLTANTAFKHALSYVAGGSKSACKGELLANGTMLASAIPTGITRLNLGNRYDGARPMSGHLRSFKYWNRALSGTELQRITT